ncbi:hypothetical protein K491DRAFT_690067 [Lophiostoma macrostomum CBS 122681]|uniref:Pre-mRNA-splicing factor 38B n=1 Tax=Lophiostoma macrostomum CBS 122681 TaxID=1314788 RepID=A0A6A6TFQ9_9PLEO|nr:hypothetical protein K491DRAFT_690067 [Lophiostoma macrostomum CBS 122681]
MADNIDDDEYVANLLKQDATDAAKQYKMVGLDAFKPARARSGAPKPNTRFLRHIIRETDSHNSALLAKEAEESRARLRRMERATEREARAKDVGRLTPPALTDDEHSHRKRKRSEPHLEEEDDHQYRKRRATHRETEHHASRKERDRESGRRKHRDRSHSRESNEHHSKGRAERPSRHEKYGRSHSGDYEEARSRRNGASSRRHRRSRSYLDSPPRSSSPARYRKHHSSRRERTKHYSDENRSLSPERKRRKARDSRQDGDARSRSPIHNSDSDPLEALVGPLPPSSQATVRARGRGAYKANSMAMDTRFSSSYNPSADVGVPPEDEDEWGDALEALKDRQRWKQQGADRLKAAGFTEDEIKKWEKGDKKNEDDVTWATEGQREWDRGKVVDQEGEVDLKADWGRLK